MILVKSMTLFSELSVDDTQGLSTEMLLKFGLRGFFNFGSLIKKGEVNLSLCSTIDNFEYRTPGGLFSNGGEFVFAKADYRLFLFSIILIVEGDIG